ncbi:MAG: sugar ABC transporter permease, partial [Mycoplasma sp.]|nr:sugar ABC transporter permease [Mycoplasma sp.]
KNLKYLNSRINDEEKKIPLKTFKNHSWISLFISLLLPGSGQIFNRQYIKGLLLMSLNLFIIFSILMMTGALSFEGLGISGLFKLKEIKYTSKITQTIYYDARFLIIEGVLATLFLTLSIVIYLSIAKDAFNNGKLLELGVRPKNNYELKKYFMDKGLPIALSIPAFMLILIIVVTPLASTIILAFTNYSGFNTPPGKPIEYVGFRNFGDIFSGEYARSFFYVSKWTVMWTILATGGVIITGVILAIIVDNPYVRGKKLWYIIFILPWAIPAFATTLFFGIAFNPGGFYNKWFKDVDFKNTIWLARSLIVLLQIWLGHSYIFLLVLGVKKSISNDLYEAAAIDGASKNQQFFKITWPLILAQIVPILVGTMVFYFNNFGIIYLFSSGGPIAETLPGYPGATDIIISFIFKLATTQNNRVSLASAFILFTSIFVVTPSAITFIRSNAFKKDGK